MRRRQRRRRAPPSACGQWCLELAVCRSFTGNSRLTVSRSSAAISGSETVCGVQAQVADRGMLVRLGEGQRAGTMIAASIGMLIRCVRLAAEGMLS